MSTLKVSTISPLGTDATKTITIGSAGDTAAGVFTNTPSFFAKLSSSQSISSGSFTKITFDTEEWDTGGGFDTSNNRFVVPANQAGKYVITAGIYIDGLDDGEYDELFIYKNGSSINWGRQNSNSPRTDAHGAFTTTATLNLAVSDYVEIYVYQNEGAARNADANYTFMSGHRLIGA